MSSGALAPSGCHERRSDKDLGTRIGRRRPLDDSGIQIDDPVLRDAFVAEQRAFGHAIGACRARRQNLDGKQQAVDVVKMLGAAPVEQRRDEDVRLYETLVGEFDIGGRNERVAYTLALQVFAQQRYRESGQLPGGEGMAPASRTARRR